MHSGARRNNKLATGQVDVKIYAASSQQKCMSGGTFCSQKYAIRPISDYSRPRTAIK